MQNEEVMRPFIILLTGLSGAVYRAETHMRDIQHHIQQLREEG